MPCPRRLHGCDSKRFRKISRHPVSDRFGRSAPQAVPVPAAPQGSGAKELKNPDSARKTVNEILKNMKSLGRFPEQGPSVEALTGFKTDLRILLCDKHIALYRIENGTVLISRIVDARQDYLRILFGEDYLD